MAWKFLDRNGNKKETDPYEGSILISKGDLLYHDGSGVNRIPIGSTGEVLTVSNGVPIYNKPLYTQRSDNGTNYTGTISNGNKQGPWLTLNNVPEGIILSKLVILNRGYSLALSDVG